MQSFANIDNLANMSEMPENCCFVVSPIGAEGSAIRKRADQFIKFIVTPAIGDLYDIVRADQITTPGSINRQVFQHVLKARLVVADLSGHNPNVFYELAVRHAFARPYVQMIDSGDNIPFDLFDQRSIKFNLADLDSVDAAKVALRSLAVATRHPNFRVVTPIGEAAQAIDAFDHAPADIRTVLALTEKQFNIQSDRIIEMIAELGALRQLLVDKGQPPVRHDTHQYGSTPAPRRVPSQLGRPEVTSPPVVPATPPQFASDGSPWPECAVCHERLTPGANDGNLSDVAHECDINILVNWGNPYGIAHRDCVARFAVASKEAGRERGSRALLRYDCPSSTFIWIDALGAESVGVVAGDIASEAAKS